MTRLASHGVRLPRRLLPSCSLVVHVACPEPPPAPRRRRRDGRAAARRVVLALRELRRVPQQPVHARRRRRVDRHRVAVDDDGELRARPVLARQRSARDARPPCQVARHPGRVRGLPHADGAEGRRGRRGTGHGLRASGRPAYARCARPTRPRRRVLHGLPPDRRRRPRHARQLQRQLPPSPAARRRRARRCSVRSPWTPGRQHDHALGDRVRAGGGAARASVRALRDLPHAHHRGRRPRRPRHRIAAGADELPGMAAQRVLRRAAQLPVAATCRGPSGPRPRLVGARRRSATACRGTRSSAGTRSCSGC